MKRISKALFTINMVGANKASAGTDEMIESVVEALESQYPKASIIYKAYNLNDVKTPVLMVPIANNKPKRSK
jgi:hypothetical protein